MTTLPVAAPAETRSAESGAAPVVAAAAVPEAAQPAGFADALLALSAPAQPLLMPAMPPVGQQPAGQDGQASAEQDGDASSGLDVLLLPTPQPTALPIPPSLPLPSMAKPDMPSRLAVGALSPDPADSLPQPAAVPSLAVGILPASADGRSVGQIPVLPSVSDGGAATLASAHGATAGALPAWLGQTLPGAGQPALPEWAPVTLPAGQSARWGESLRAALGERMDVQSAHGIDRALIRLDPPSFGSLEIAIRHEAGALTVQLVASHGEVVRQLQAIGDALRQDLSARQYTQVAVEVREGAPGGGLGQQGQGRSGRDGQQDNRTPGQALAEAGSEGNGPFALG
ncbi:flagellar hook-length control protein FliK [Pseudogulbenkiania sp. MAI-1]|uniref:flagellar hook-length control protein FliK n=1 Tax=Pseudogulbenkiania sp. MAI-1 TaxID=990370 RepID=UPI00045E93FC|nr:flagellar hook-length control protein FliK [Pseudogulbenkiania sp. MAI-1]